MSIKLEAGRRYVMRNGEVTGVLEDNINSVTYLFTDGRDSWTNYGGYWNGRMTEWDIVAEYTEGQRPKRLNGSYLDNIADELFSMLGQTKGVDPCIHDKVEHVINELDRLAPIVDALYDVFEMKYPETVNEMELNRLIAKHNNWE